MNLSSWFLPLVERGFHNSGWNQLATNLNSDGCPHLGVTQRNIGKAHVFSQVRSGASTGDRTNGLAVDDNCIAISSDSFAFHFETDQLSIDSALLLFKQCLSANKVTFCHFYNPSEICFPGSDLVRDLMAIERQFGFQAESISCA